ncbi:MAG: hypothetical protein J5808_02835, partial [Paludibacteraceae bacterium]|nr:hypothetical protein [Paludibacteraceae bacterium]
MITADATVPTVTINAASTTLNCATNQIVLTAQGDAQSYEWSNGANTASITVNAANTYSVTGTAANGCTTTANITISEDFDAPTVTIDATNDVFSCNTNRITLTASGNDIQSYHWSTNDNKASITIYEPGTYTVTAIGANGCNANKAVTIGEDTTAPTVGITTDVETINCYHPTATLTATGNGISFLWSNYKTTEQITCTTGGTYTVTATAANGCTAQASVSINSDVTKPVVVIKASTKQLTCAKEEALLEVITNSENVSYAWSTGASDYAITVTETGTYTVDVIGSNGCVKTAETTITEDYTAPTISIEAPDVILTCNDPSVTLTAVGEGYAGLRWSTNARTESITVKTGGEYTVTATARNGCTAEATHYVNADQDAPVFFLTASADTLRQTRPMVTLSAEAGYGVSYLWTPTGKTDATIEVTQAGVYTVTVTNDNNGCSATQSKKIIDGTDVNEIYAQNVEVIGSKGKITVTFDGMHDVMLYTMNGRLLADKRNVKEQIRFENLNDGIYMVVVDKVGYKAIVK